ncbi:hypothetical protein TNIN_136371, partial [Trichonephila inaurata madagascariensis]
PDGTKLHSKPDVAAYIARNNLNVKEENFDFSEFVAPRPPIEVPKPKGAKYRRVLRFWPKTDRRVTMLRQCQRKNLLIKL